MRSTLLRLGVAGLLLVASAAQAGSPPAKAPPKKNFFEELTTALRGPDQTGQPSQECGEDGSETRPGQAQTAPGSAFNPDGKAGTVYAGEQPQNSKNTASVSQYDVACTNVSNKGR
ncbi:MAG TPA: hypothetical protein VFN88_08010 [Caulobacteraceae bacterium]|nr:hypothetical protein [Caulobacteraceae bacterium]